MRLFRLLSIAFWACGHVALAQDANLAGRIARVENGLLDPVAVRGAPPHTMTLAARMQALHVPGVSVALIDHGTVQWARAYGIADASAGTPAGVGTLFQAASISKPVTAVMVLRLANGGKPGLDDDINRTLGPWQLAGPTGSASAPVSVRALLSHTAGMPAEDLTGYAAGAPAPTLLQVLRGVPPATNGPAHLVRPPGSSYAYTGMGYAVLQEYLVERTGQTFDTLARETVFKPLGMANSLFSEALPAPWSARAASGHGLDGAVIPGKWRHYPELAAAGLWTTATDLATFAVALQHAALGHDDAPLSTAQAAALFTPVRAGYGLGFELDHDGREPAFHHSGSNAGYKSLLFAYTRTGQGAVILTNGDGGAALIDEIMRSIAAEYGWEDYRPTVRDAVTVDPARFARYVGDFAVSNTTLHISRDGDRLYASGPPLGPVAVQLIPAGDDDYFIREKDATVHFDPNGTACRPAGVVDTHHISARSSASTSKPAI